MDFSGNYNYSFSRVEPVWSNAFETGIHSLVVGFNCSFQGENEYGDVVSITEYIDGTTGFSPSLEYSYLSGHINEISNEYASGQNWYETLEARVDQKINSPRPVRDFDAIRLDKVKKVSPKQRPFEFEENKIKRNERKALEEANRLAVLEVEADSPEEPLRV